VRALCFFSSRLSPKGVAYPQLSGSFPQLSTPNLGFTTESPPISRLYHTHTKRGYPQKQLFIHSYSALFHKLRHENKMFLECKAPYLPAKRREKRGKGTILPVPFPLVAAALTATRVLSQLSHFRRAATSRSDYTIFPEWPALPAGCCRRYRCIGSFSPRRT